jgi:hypothetical protein
MDEGGTQNLHQVTAQLLKLTSLSKALLDCLDLFSINGMINNG